MRESVCVCNNENAVRSAVHFNRASVCECERERECVCVCVWVSVCVNNENAVRSAVHV